MNPTALYVAATAIVRRNLTPNVASALLHWDAAQSHMRLTYILSGAPTDEDSELQELAIAELLAEFPEVATAECQSALVSTAPAESPVGIAVYRRHAA